MTNRKGIQILHESAVNITMGSLASLTALDAATAYQTTNLTAGFLMKKIEGFAMIDGSPDPVDDIPLLVLCYGNTSIAEIAAAMVQEDPDSSDDALVDQATIRRVVIARGPDTITHSENDANTADNTFTWDLENFRLPSKGLPFLENVGWAWRFFNPTGAAFTTGAVGSFWSRIKGVWLSD